MGFDYHQVRIKDEYVHKTTFRARYGSYELVPFGFTNAPATFICLRNNIFSRYLEKFVLVFLDYILTYSKDEEKHVEQLRLILKFPRKHQLYAKLSNYEFYEYGIHHLGRIISNKGISIGPGKIEAMMSWPTPRKLTDLRYFVGLAGYCRKITK